MLLSEGLLPGSLSPVFSVPSVSFLLLKLLKNCLPLRWRIDMTCFWTFRDVSNFRFPVLQVSHFYEEKVYELRNGKVSNFVSVEIGGSNELKIRVELAFCFLTRVSIVNRKIRKFIRNQTAG